MNSMLSVVHAWKTSGATEHVTRSRAGACRCPEHRGGLLIWKAAAMGCCEDIRSCRAEGQLDLGKWMLWRAPEKRWKLGLVSKLRSVKMPPQLSGGMRQRVAIARALALDPQLMLMDEPFGALDAITREEMSRCLLDIWERTGKTIVLVTHSIGEAMFLSREVHVMGTGPARIIETLPIGLAYPRTEASFADPAFKAAQQRLRGLLIESHQPEPGMNQAAFDPSADSTPARATPPPRSGSRQRVGAGIDGGGGGRLGVDDSAVPCRAICASGAECCDPLVDR